MEEAAKSIALSSNNDEEPGAVGDVKVIFNYVEKKEILDEALANELDQHSDFENAFEFAGKVMEEIESHAPDPLQDLFASPGQLSASPSFDSENVDSFSSGRGFYVGQVVWSSLSKSKWFPSLVESVDEGRKIKVRYFNYRSAPGLINRRNLFEFTSLSDYYKQMRNRRDKKAENLTRHVLRAAEEAQFYLTIPVESRMRMFLAAQELSGEYDNLETVLFAIENDLDEEKVDMQENLLNLFQTLKKYDENTKPDESEPKRKRPSKKQERSNSPRYYTSDRLLNRVLTQMNHAPEMPVVKEEPVVMEEEEPMIREEPSVMQELDVKEEPAEFEIKMPKRKKQKIEDHKQIFRDKFLANVVEANLEHKCASDVKVCEKCLSSDNADVLVCGGVGCGRKLHRECCAQRDENGSNGFLCDQCADESHLMSCFACSHQISADCTEVINCEQQECNRAYHKKCLDKFYPFCQMQCPQHNCHSCKSRTRRKSTKLVYCISCPATYHPDLYCLPAGSQLLSKTQIICPRHKTPEEKFSKRNVSWCCICYEGGALICCDGCPRSYHIECIKQDQSIADDEIFLCYDCIDGSMPTYYSTVWVKCKNFRWWPAFILLPWTVPLRMEKYRSNTRQFCVRFFGSYEFFYTSYEQVYQFDSYGMDASTLIRKSAYTQTNKLYNLAIEQALKMVEILKREQNFAKPKHYTTIHINRAVAPVVYRKSDEFDKQICDCKPTDASPCGKDSDCLNRTLHMECSDDCPTGDKCQNQDIKKRNGVPLEIVKTEDRGFGAISTQDIEAKTFIVEYVGEIIDTKEFKHRLELKNMRGDANVYFHSVGTNLIIDAEYYGNKARFINHSCDPNCDSFKITVDGRARIGIYSKKFIPSGTELTFNYKMQYPSTAISSICYCGSENCTGVIGRIKASNGKMKK